MIRRLTPWKIFAGPYQSTVAQVRPITAVYRRECHLSPEVAEHPRSVSTSRHDLSSTSLAPHSPASEAPSLSRRVSFDEPPPEFVVGSSSGHHQPPSPAQMVYPGPGRSALARKPGSPSPHYSHDDRGRRISIPAAKLTHVQKEIVASRSIECHPRREIKLTQEHETIRILRRRHRRTNILDQQSQCSYGRVASQMSVVAPVLLCHGLLVACNLYWCTLNSKASSFP